MRTAFHPIGLSRAAALVAALLAAAVGACKDLGPGTKGSSQEGTGSTHILLTDDPFPYYRVSRVDLYVVSVSVSLSADTGGPGSAGGDFVTVARPQRRINLLALRDGTAEELGSADLPRGAIVALRMVIDTDSSSITLKDGRVLTGSTKPGIWWYSSAGRPVLNALIQEQLLVPDTGAVIVIDFDVGNSFVPVQEVEPPPADPYDSSFGFSAVLRAADYVRTGVIRGTVRSAGAAGSPVADASVQLYLGWPTTPENTWPRMATARTDSAGAFLIPLVTRSAFWELTPWYAGATYIVTVDPPPGSGLERAVVSNITVDAGRTADLGLITLP
jgi:hypothetical protein